MPLTAAAKIQSKRNQTVLIFSILLAGAALGGLPGIHTSSSLISPPSADAQNFGRRIIQGKVVDEAGSYVNGATVFLKDLKSRDVRSFTSTPDGSFRFAQVGMVDDYEVWAEQGKKKSAVKTVSSFDSRKELDFDLKLK